MSKRHTFGLAKADAARLTGALVLLKPYLTSLALVWPKMSAEQKRAYVEHSPVFSRVIDLVRPFKDVM